jgi:hypothetical protein
VDDQVNAARAALFFTAIQMHQIFVYLSQHEDEISDPAKLFVGKVLVTIARYCKITSEAIENPTESETIRLFF